MGDRFGAAVEFIGDLDGDGFEDVLIGAPDTPMGGSVYLFPGPYAGICAPVVAASRAGKIIDKPDSDAYDFGFSVGPLYDFNSDGYSDFRVAAHYLDAAGVEQTRTYIYDGFIGYPVAAITGAIGVDGLAPLPGDANGDGVVTMEDLARVAVNLGQSGNLTPAKGDVVQDGTVDATDINLVANQQGAMLYQGHGATPPADFDCDSANGCPSYAVQDGGGEWLCVRLMNCSSPWSLTIDASGNVALAQQSVGDPIFTGNAFCDRYIQECMAQYTLGSPLQIALSTVIARCGGVPSHGTLCRTNCPRGMGGVTILVCDPAGSGTDERHPVIVICVDANIYDLNTFCATLAHEMVHLSQACLYGFMDQQSNCQSVLLDWNNQYHRMCQEYEAYSITGECDTLECDTLVCCCQKSCGNEFEFWRNCAHTCLDCCVFGAEECCVNGRNVCLDGTGPSTSPCSDPP